MKPKDRKKVMTDEAETKIKMGEQKLWSRIMKERRNKEWNELTLIIAGGRWFREEWNLVNNKSTQ
jgi:hypothetical protein